MKPLYGEREQVPQSLRIVFLGDSITDEGTYIAYLDAYIRQYLPDRQVTLINLGVSSETASGLSEPAHPFPRPCVHDRLERALRESRPDWVVFCYGMNDGIYYPFAEERFAAYREGITRLINGIKEVGAKVIAMTPPPFDPQSQSGANLLPDGADEYSYMTPYNHYNDVLDNYADWLQSLNDRLDGFVPARERMTRWLGRERTADRDYVSGDGIHPNAAGHWEIARQLLKSLFNITAERVPGFVAASPDPATVFSLVWQRHRMLSAAWKEHVGHTNENKATDALPLDEALALAARLDEEIAIRVTESNVLHDEATSQWQGYERVDFYFQGREALIIKPKSPVENHRWIWRVEFFDAFAAADMAMLELGYALVYFRISDQYGSPYAVKLMGEFQAYVTDTYGLAARTTLFGFSRGGLYSMLYAAAYPNNVAVIYLDAPVLDIRSWPGGKGAGSGAPHEWYECLAVYGLEEQESEKQEALSPLNKLEPLAAAGIPILLVAGDADVPVPLSENGDILVERYRSLGGTIEAIVKPGVGHHPHSLDNPQPIVRFVESNWT